MHLIIRKLLTGTGIKYEDFSIAFSLSNVSEIEHFVAREEELAEMHGTLSGDGSRRTVVLHGLGGIGKTQLAVAYAKRHKDNYSAIFWLNIKDEDSLKQSFANLARQILREHPSASRLSSVDIKKLRRSDGCCQSVAESPQQHAMADDIRQLRQPKIARQYGSCSIGYP